MLTNPDVIWNKSPERQWRAAAAEDSRLGGDGRPIAASVGDGGAVISAAGPDSISHVSGSSLRYPADVLLSFPVLSSHFLSSVLC